MNSNRILVFYCFFVCLFLMVAGLFSAKDSTQLFNSFIYLPLIFYFGTRLLHFVKKPVPKVVKKKEVNLLTSIADTEQAIEPEIVAGVPDNDKRLFLKLIGSTGFSLLLMALFTKKAQASFFGSAPLGPGVVGVKDLAGNRINPAEKNPTDGYEITNIDDTGTPAYYGFVKSTGAWYIMEEGATGAYRYAKGDTSFSTNWTIRSSLTYDYFNNIFG